jgi:hypothetical protein
MIVQQVHVMDVHFIFFYEHHLLVQLVIKIQMVIEHLSDHVNSVDKKYEKYPIRMCLFNRLSLLYERIFFIADIVYKI